MNAYRAGRAGEAVELCRLVLGAQPDHFDAIALMGACAMQAGDPAAARQWFERAIAVAPSDAQARNNLGVALQQAGLWEESLAAFSRAVELAPGYADAWFNRGIVLGEMARWDDALAAYRRAHEANRSNPRFLNNTGNALQKLLRWEEALGAYDAALALWRNYPEALNNRGAVNRELRRWNEAMRDYDAALAARPAYPEALNNRSVALREQSRWDEAVATAKDAIAARADYPEAWHNLGFALHDMRRFPESIAAYDRALELRPSYAEPRWNLALLNLLRGDYREGFELFEWRWKTADIAPHRRDFGAPLWLGKESLEGKTLLVHSEQGLGDIIQFSRWVPLAAKRARQVVFEVPAVLARLMAASFPEVEVVARGSPLPAFDAQVPVASLPLAFEARLDNLPGAVGYLAAPAEALERWKARLGPRERLRVGLAWAGNPAQRNDHNRSMPFARIAALLDLDCEFHCLQKDIPARDRAEVEASDKLMRWSDELHDFAETAALVSALDLVISVDTSASHLAGALGQRTWIALTYAADYRYLLDRDDSPWYGNATLYRQRQAGDWKGVIDAIARDLEPLAHAAPR